MSDTKSDYLTDLDASIAAEDAQDEATAETDPSQRTITAFDGFAEGGVTPREAGSLS